jgi:hypothetical protein
MAIEYFSDGYRRQWKCYCDVCGKFLYDTSHPSEHYATREEIGNLICADCQKKIEAGLIQAPERGKNRLKGPDPTGDG